MAKVVYSVDHLNYGDADERTGWYLIRLTIADDRGRGLASGSIVDRKPVARFDHFGPGSDLTMSAGEEALMFASYGKRVVFKEDTIESMAKL